MEKITFNFNNRTAIVTGGAQGFGLDITKRFLKSGAKGPIYFCLMDPALPGEIEIDTGCKFPVTPQVKGAIKSLEGVLEVEEV